MKRYIISGYYVYRTYVSFKSHFKGDINLSKYDFKIISQKKLPFSSYEKRKDVKYFELLADKIRNKEELFPFFIAVFLKKPDIWIGEIVSNFLYWEKIKNAWEKKIDNIDYIFKNDIEHLLRYGLNFSSSDSLCKILSEEFFKSNIEIETFIIMKCIFNLDFSEYLEFSYFYDDRHKAYESILTIDILKFRNILKEVILSFK